MTDLLVDTNQNEGADDAAALDAYSATVVTVAERVVPSVAALSVAARGRQGAGSGVALTADGYVLTSAHVVAGAERGRATFPDGREMGFEVVGRDPLSDLAVLRADAAISSRSTSATPTSSASGSSSLRWVIPTVSRAP